MNSARYHRLVALACRPAWIFATVVALIASVGESRPAYAAKVSRNILKSYFETGDQPTQSQFSNLIDSALNLTDDGLTSFRSAARPDGGAARFDEGAVIGSDLTFGSVAGLSDEWAGLSGFMPLELTQGSHLLYGYLQVRAGDAGSGDLYPMHVDYLVFEDQPGVPIAATAVPEPATLTLAGIAGLPGLMYLKRRRVSQRIL